MQPDTKAEIQEVDTSQPLEDEAEHNSWSWSTYNKLNRSFLSQPTREGSRGTITEVRESATMETEKREGNTTGDRSSVGFTYSSLQDLLVEKNGWLVYSKKGKILGRIKRRRLWFELDPFNESVQFFTEPSQQDNAKMVGLFYLKGEFFLIFCEFLSCFFHLNLVFLQIGKLARQFMMMKSESC